MSILSKLFGRKGAEADTPSGEDYEGFTIFAEPMKEGSSYRLAARIEKSVNGEDKVHQLIRADTFTDLEEAVKASRGKAIQMIDEQGVRLFG